MAWRCGRGGHLVPAAVASLSEAAASGRSSEIKAGLNIPNKEGIALMWGSPAVHFGPAFIPRLAP